MAIERAQQGTDTPGRGSSFGMDLGGLSGVPIDGRGRGVQGRRHKKPGRGDPPAPASFLLRFHGRLDDFGLWWRPYAPPPLTAKPLGPSPVADGVPAILAR
jgi:hypothetical protein